MLVMLVVVMIVDRLVVHLLVIVVLNVVVDAAGVQDGVTEKHIVLADVLVSIVLRWLEQIGFAYTTKQCAIVTRCILARVIVTNALYLTIIIVAVVWVIGKAGLDRFELSQLWLLFNRFKSCGDPYVLVMLLWSDTTMIEHFILIFAMVFLGDARVGELLGKSLHPRIVRVNFLSRVVRLRSS